MKKNLLALFLFSSSFLFSFAQKEGDIWYFGEYAGLDFNSGAPVPVNNGQQLTTLEGCATICDKTTGQLLFYTDGTYVWDKNNNLMPNGTGLYGSFSATQSAVIVPMPGSTTLYYIFTVDAQAGNYTVSWSGYGGAAYSIVDMTQNGGLGDVTTKNTELLTPTCEKLTAVRHCDGEDIWIVTHQWNTNAFYAYLLTSAGLSAPVISNQGDVQYNASGDGYNDEALGYMKFSPDASKLVTVTYPWINEVQIFDFNNSTGVISNPIIDNTLVFYYDDFGDIYNGLYGATFSPDNSKLYVAETGYTIDFETEPSTVYQYNMLAGSNAAILASRTLVHSTTSYAIGALQIGPDGKIYVAKESESTGPYNHLDVINSPNSLGAACNYVNNGLSLVGSGGLSEYGLPDIVETFLVPQYTTTLIYPGCNGNDTISFTDSLNGTIAVNWNFGDPASGAANTSTLQNATHTFSSLGTYTVSVQLSNNCKTDTYSKTFTIYSLPVLTVTPSSSSICNGQTTSTLTTSGAASYSWSPGGSLSNDTSSTPIATPSATTTYTVTGSNGGGCSSTKTVTISVNSISASASSPVTICNGQTTTLSASGGSSYAWIPPISLSDASVYNPTAYPSGTTTYTVTVTGAGGCTGTATTTVTVNTVPPTPTITQSITGDTLFSSTDASYGSYQWYKDSVIMPGQTSDTLVVTGDTASFSVVVTASDGCVNKAEFSNRDLPIELLSFDAIYNGKTVDLLWSTASEINNNFFTVERTKDGLDFTPVVYVKGAGNSTSLLNYHAVDENPLFGISAYRLKQTDFDGKYQYSRLVAVSIKLNGKLEVRSLTTDAEQNSINYLVISPSGKPFNIEITDRIGKVMVEKTSTEGSGTIDFSGFAHGVYLFKAFDDTGSSVKKFIY